MESKVRKRKGLQQVKTTKMFVSNNNACAAAAASAQRVCLCPRCKLHHNSTGDTCIECNKRHHSNGKDIVDLYPPRKFPLKQDDNYKLRLCTECGKMHVSIWPACKKCFSSLYTHGDAMLKADAIDNGNVYNKRGPILMIQPRPRITKEDCVKHSFFHEAKQIWYEDNGFLVSDWNPDQVMQICEDIKDAYEQRFKEFMNASPEDDKDAVFRVKEDWCG